MSTGRKICGNTEFIVGMTQLVFGAALGFIIGQGVLRGIKHFFGGWFQRHRLVSLQGSAVVAGFIKYAGALGAVAALLTFAIWLIGDSVRESYPASVETAVATDSTAAAPVPDLQASVSASASAPADADDEKDLTPAPAKAAPAATVVVAGADPYADSDFKVHRQRHRAGTSAALKDTLLQRSEALARADLLKQTQEHMRRSQYDCEAAARASKYVQAGLDVWGFEAWQVKYFPMDGYRGATLGQCKDIKKLVDSPRPTLQATTATNESHL